MKVFILALALAAMPAAARSAPARCGKYADLPEERRRRAEEICTDAMQRIDNYIIASENAARSKYDIERICGCILKVE